MATTDTQQAAQFSAEAAVSAAEAKQYLIEAQHGYQDTSAAAQEAKDAAAAAATSEQNATYSEANAAQSAAAAVDAKDDAEAAASSASDYAKNKFTFYKTASDPDGTIAGLAATTDGQSFWVAQGPDALSAAWQYQNKAGVAVLQAKQPGTAAITGTIREFPTLAAAQADTDAGNILSGSKCWVTNSSDVTLADEYINNAGTLTVTGRKMPSQGYVDRVINISTDNTNITVTFDSDGGVVDVRDAFGGVNIPDIPSPVQDILKQIKKNASPFLNVLTDAENQAFESVCDFGSLRIPGIPVGIAEMLQATRKKTEKLYKYRRVIDAREFGLNSKTGEDAHRAIQAGYDALSARGGGVLYIPEGYYKLAVPIIPRPNVSLIGAGQNATVLLPFGYLAAITYQGAETYIENLQFSDFTIDGENQQLHPVNGYIPDIKGIYLQYYRNTIFDRLTIRNTGATGLGVDMPDRVSMTRCLVENCGRLATVGALGASGFGLGTSFLSSEPLFASQLIGRNNKNFGIFFEPQRGTGTAQDAIVTDSTFYGNYAGLADCGIEGLIAANLNLRNNQYGFVAEPGTNNGGNAGFRGKLNNCIIKANTSHGMYFNTGKGDTIIGEYAITDTHISENGEDGINIRYATEVTNSSLRVSDCDINNNGRHGVNFEAGPVVNADVINNRIWNNGKTTAGNGVNSSRAMTKCRISNNSIRDIQATATQQYPVSISGNLTDTDISFNHCVGNAQNSLNLTGTQTRVTTINNPGIA
ncbi:right-handed parallel beta-helix repeat-containing protein [Klebsiella michiganensis]|uniref:right-handed parallel beta-helix repeat-containing protein n=1 Tax=Klebsiella michiganensis TaxID=1134687 RepID=UPI002551BF89|nr:right-handed parallel beta-helix repeat-containing protein [Klebsiella michiganensis]MDK8020027.1 right-handed parallel beta-helix repeat-containing protein [Klebsiella michiganensis]